MEGMEDLGSILLSAAGLDPDSRDTEEKCVYPYMSTLFICLKGIFSPAH